ncbi:cytochrome P450 [Peniophora sp. CONT]|nr:cytochrome P450 [Peniophora sp. CONT]
MLGAVLSLSASVVAYCAYRYFKALQHVGHLPGIRSLIPPISPFGVILPNNSLNPGNLWSWHARGTAYSNYQQDIISVVTYFPSTPCYFTCSIDIIKQVAGNELRIHAVKPQDLTLASLVGDNVASAGGEVWRRHRRVVAPAFTPEIHKAAWDISVETVHEMFEGEGWNSQQQVSVDHIHPVLLKLTLIILCKAAFGFPATWKPSGADSHDFMDSLHTVAETIIPRIVLPQKAYSLTTRLREIDNAWSAVSAYIQQAINNAKTTQELDQGAIGASVNILERLASFANADKNAMSEKDLSADMYTLLFAGHETGASGLLTTLGYLAVYQAEQQAIVDEIENAPPFDEAMTTDVNVAERFPHALHSFWEGLRLIPPPQMIPREMTEDVPVHYERPVPGDVVLKKGDKIIMDFLGTFRNPHYFEDPHVFRPSRWANAPDHDFFGFGFGPRACVGRRFAQIESVAIITTLLREWKIEPVLQEGETPSGFETRVLGNAGLVGTSFALIRVPLKFSKRSV